MLSSKLAFNSLFLLVAKGFTFGSSFLASLIIIRYRGLADYGQFSFVFAFISLFSVLASLSLEPIVIRHLAQSAASPEETLGNALWARISAGLGSMVLVLLIIPFFPYDAVLKNEIRVGSLSLLFGAGLVLSAYFQARLLTRSIAYTDGVSSVLLLAGMAAAVWSRIDLLWLFFFQALFPLAQSLLLLCVYRSNTGLWPNIRLRLGEVWKLVLEARPLLFANLFIILNLRLDQLLIFHFLGSRETGIYAGLARITELWNFVPTILMASAYPLLCKMHAGNSALFQAGRRGIFRLLSWIVFPIPLLITMFREKIIFLAYGAPAAAGAPTLAVLIWSVVFVFLGIGNSTALTAAGLQAYLLPLTLTGGLSNLLLNLWFIPSYGIWGAAVATVISYSIPGLFLQYLIKPTRPYVAEYIASLVRPGCAILPLCALWWFQPDRPVLAAAAGMGMYALAACRTWRLSSPLEFLRALEAPANDLKKTE
ncbi:MAG TPA: flippase [Candidatus Ozemobacteraceae bacterium]|nr:flippase [Candidatus Ozemobacteraceae bacterium]